MLNAIRKRLVMIRESTAVALDNIRHVNPKAPVFEVSARDGRGMDAWLKWVRG